MNLPSEDAVEPFRLSPGFFAFVGLLLAPAIAALAIYLGAWLVADEVRAAQSASGEQGSEFAITRADEVAGWKKTLVGICPAH
ncbi:MAG: hypothetical protein GEU75_01975 [Dehalococcoidia bacterium]|nr:hypothetical protein [Dehalococcoidia bacterium]